jgi:hypothetical protein
MPDRVRAAAKRIWDRFWIVVDDEAVVLFKYIFGVIFIAAGLYGIFVAGQQPPLSMRGAMGHMDVRIWYWLNVLGPLCSLAGKSMRGDLEYAGMWLQLGGDLAVTLFLLAYITGTVQVESWGNGAAYGAFLGMGFFFAAIIMVTRDVRRLLQVEKQVR